MRVHAILLIYRWSDIVLQRLGCNSNVDGLGNRHGLALLGRHGLALLSGISRCGRRHLGVGGGRLIGGRLLRLDGLGFAGGGGCGRGRRDGGLGECFLPEILNELESGLAVDLAQLSERRCKTRRQTHTLSICFFKFLTPLSLQ